MLEQATDLHNFEKSQVEKKNLGLNNLIFRDSSDNSGQMVASKCRKYPRTFERTLCLRISGIMPYDHFHSLGIMNFKMHLRSWEKGNALCKLEMRDHGRRYEVS